MAFPARASRLDKVDQAIALILGGFIQSDLSCAARRASVVTVEIDTRACQPTDLTDSNLGFAAAGCAKNLRKHKKTGAQVPILESEPSVVPFTSSVSSSSHIESVSSLIIWE